MKSIKTNELKSQKSLLLLLFNISLQITMQGCASNRPNNVGNNAVNIVIGVVVVTSIIYLCIKELSKSEKQKRGRSQTEKPDSKSVQEPNEYQQNVVHPGESSVNTVISDRITDVSRAHYNEISNFSSAESLGDWLTVGASVPGKSHVASSLPCQDSHIIATLSETWNIIIVSDGAGTAKHSHYGSQIAVREALSLFKDFINLNGHQWTKNLPSQNEWWSSCASIFKQIRIKITEFSSRNNHIEADYACSLIIIIFSRYGILSAHIGDGRAGYRDINGTWHSLMTPFKGKEANETTFITSQYTWLSSNIEKTIECRVVNDSPSAVTAMSDGCEHQSFRTGYFDKESQVFISQNEPYPPFFEPLVSQLMKELTDGTPIEHIQKKWLLFLTESSNFRNEPDDKTLLLAINISNSGK